MQFTLTFEGNLGDQPELRFTPAKKAFCKLRVGHNTRRRTTAGEWVNGETVWFTVTVWEALAERVATSLHKGDTVTVEARNDLSIWAYLNQATNKPAGQLQVTAANVSLSLRFKPAKAFEEIPAETFDDPWDGDDARDLEPAF